MKLNMNKTLIVHKINDIDNIPAMERWFARCHCPEVMAQEPWLTRYMMFRVLPPAEGMEELGFMNYRVHENWNLDIDNRRGVKGLLEMTPEPVENAMNVAIINVPAEPTEDFFGQNRSHVDPPCLRFVVLFSYPDGVSTEEGEDWYLNVHAPEICRLPGLKRFFSHKTYKNYPAPLPMPEEDDVAASENGFFDQCGGQSLFFHKWNRVSEMWFEKNSDWTYAFSHAQFTKPSWATRDTYPFVEPMKDFVCTSLLERPDQNILKNYEGMIY